MQSRRFVSPQCNGEKCFCGKPAEHKIEEAVMPGDPHPFRHALTSYVCNRHFCEIMMVTKV